MVKYTCEKCGKEFAQKSHYTAHMNKKTPCMNEVKVKEIIDNAVKEKLVEIKKASASASATGIELETAKAFDKFIYSDKLVKSSNNKKVNILKPVLKWVGGKTQIMDKLIAEFPVEINNYHEIFLGGGSVLLTLLSYVKEGIIKIHGQVYAYDLNEPLIYVYKNIQSHHNEVYDNLQKIISEFNTCTSASDNTDAVVNRTPTTLEEAMQEKESYYYWSRMMYNKLSLNDKKSALGSAMFIFLNKTCFRGVFRVGPKGFNVPYGHYKNPEIINKEHLENIHELIQGVIFECNDFNISLNQIASNDYVYLDPPYAPETDTSFVGYTENGFSIDNHRNLFKLIHNLTETNKKCMLSNADVELIRENFTTDIYKIDSILCKRAINSKNPEAKAKEVIIKNY